MNVAQGLHTIVIKRGIFLVEMRMRERRKGDKIIFVCIHAISRDLSISDSSVFCAFLSQKNVAGFNLVSLLFRNAFALIQFATIYFIATIYICTLI